MGLNQVRRVAGESDEDREVRLQALRTKKVLDPGSVPLEFVVSVLVTVVSFTLTSFSSHLIVGGRGDAVMPIMSVYRLPQGQYGYSGHVVNLSQDVASFVQSLPRLPSELDVINPRRACARVTVVVLCVVCLSVCSRSSCFSVR